MTEITFTPQAWHKGGQAYIDEASALRSAVQSHLASLDVGSLGSDNGGHPVDMAISLVVPEAAAAVAAVEPGVVLAADTTVVAGRRILGKPADAAEAEAFLRLLSGRRHHVLTAVTVIARGAARHRLVDTTVRFRQLTAADIVAYVASGHWRGKAGGYGIQGPAGAFVPWMQGSFTAVVGLPLAETATLLAAAGIRAGHNCKEKA